VTTYALGSPAATAIILANLIVLPMLVVVTFLMVRSLRRRGLLDQGLIHIIFLPERRRHFFGLFVLLVIFFLLSGFNAGLGTLGLTSDLVQNIISAIAYGGGAICLFLLVWVALRPMKLSEERRRELERLSHSMVMLAFAPADARDPAPRRD
jgi:heme A synthase